MKTYIIPAKNFDAIIRKYPRSAYGAAHPICGHEPTGKHGFMCNRPHGHNGPHVGYATHYPIAVWRQDEN